MCVNSAPTLYITSVRTFSLSPHTFIYIYMFQKKSQESSAVPSATNPVNHLPPPTPPPLEGQLRRSGLTAA